VRSHLPKTAVGGDCDIVAILSELIQTITLGMQTSGDDDRTDKHVLELRKLLAVHCKGPYSDEISEFALVLRIGGNMQEFGAACLTAPYAVTSPTLSKPDFCAAYTV